MGGLGQAVGRSDGRTVGTVRTVRTGTVGPVGRSDGRKDRHSTSPRTCDPDRLTARPPDRRPPA